MEYVIFLIIYILSMNTFLIALYHEGIAINKPTATNDDKVFFTLAFIPGLNTVIAVFGAVISMYSLIKYIIRK